jgi:pilus assembly protein CpaE
MNSDFSAFVMDEASAAMIRAWAERQGFAPDSVQNGGAETLAALLESEAPSKLVFVDMDNHDQPTHAASRLAGLCGSSSRLVAIGSANDVSLYRGMMAAGMVDYLVKPLTPEMLTQAMVQAPRGSVAAAANEAKIIVMCGLRGGVGASTIAINTGWLIAHDLKRKCALLDLDLQFGTSALALDIEPGHGFRELVSSPQRVDSLMVSGATVNESDNFAVMSAEEIVDDIIHIDNAAVSMLIKEMKANYRVVIVDLPRHLIAAQKRLFMLAHEIVLITEMSLVGIRDTLRVRTALKSLGVTARVSLVATRVGPQRAGAVDEATFAKGAGAKIDFFLPEDGKNVTAASNAGKTLGALAKNAPLTKNLLQMAHYLVGPDKETESKKGTASKGILGKMFGDRKQASDGAS